MNKPAPKSKPLILVDGSSYLYRAFHALPALTTSGGQPTGAIYGVVNMLRKLINDYQPDLMAVVFDAKGKTFRDDLYPDYKANRPPMPVELRGQIEPLHEVVRALGLPLLSIPGVEADDVIGTLAMAAEAAGLSVIISTGDKDMAQLVDGNINLINTMTDSFLDPDGVVAKFGVRPEQIIDYLALIGDTSDNVPGVPKVGPKTAQKWLAEYHDLDAIIDNSGEFKGKIGENLRASLDFLPLSRRLVTIKTDVELDRGPTELKRDEGDQDALRDWYGKLEFKTWLAELLPKGGAAVAVTESGAAAPSKAGFGAPATSGATEYQIILHQEDLTDWLKRLEKADLFAFDLETTSLDYMQAEIVGLSFAVECGKAAYLPVAHDYPGAPPQLERADVLRQFKSLLENPRQAKLGQNLKYDMSVLANYGIRLRGIAYDTMLESYVLDSTATRHDMDSLALKYLAHKTIHFEDVAGKGKKQLTFNQIDLEQAAPYAAEDADVTLRLHQSLWPRLRAEPGLEKVFREIELPLVPVLSEIERTGVLVDAKMLAAQSTVLAKRILEIEEQAFAQAGQPFNLNSPKQLQVILFEKLELEPIQKTPKGQPSTAENVLQELALVHPLPKLILEHRSMSKLKSTYTDKLPEQINPQTGRVHTSYHQAVAATGRLSSSDPNLQNIPIRSEEGRRIRQAFVAPEGSSILAADYSQIELRIMAHLSGDPGLLDAFAQGEDIHRATAAEVFGAKPEAVSTEQRRSAKAINFGLIYGMSAFGLARQLGIDRGQAQNYIDLYFERYPGVRQYMDGTRQYAREQGYVETVFGRRLYVPDISASNANRRQYAERTAINAPMQGSAADIIKIAMLRVYDWLHQNEQLGIRMIMQVHDELVFEVPRKALQQARKDIPSLMARAADLRVPLVVDVGVGDNWDEAH